MGKFSLFCSKNNKGEKQNACLLTLLASKNGENDGVGGNKDLENRWEALSHSGHMGPYMTSRQRI